MLRNPGGTWRIIPISKWLGSPPFRSHEVRPFGIGPSHNPILRGRSLITMVISHLPTGKPTYSYGKPTIFNREYIFRWVDFSSSSLAQLDTPAPFIGSFQLQGNQLVFYLATMKFSPPGKTNNSNGQLDPFEGHVSPIKNGGFSPFATLV